jgi:hypothetical protein
MEREARRLGREDCRRRMRHEAPETETPGSPSSEDGQAGSLSKTSLVGETGFGHDLGEADASAESRPALVRLSTSCQSGLRVSEAPLALLTCDPLRQVTVSIVVLPNKTPLKKRGILLVGLLRRYSNSGDWLLLLVPAGRAAWGMRARHSTTGVSHGWQPATGATLSSSQPTVEEDSYPFNGDPCLPGNRRCAIASFKLFQVFAGVDR